MTNEMIEKNQNEMIHSSSTDFLLDASAMNAMHAMSKLMASAKVTVPKHLQGSPADCLAIIMQAAQWKMNPFAVAQKTHLVNGTLGYEAQLINAVISSSKAIVGRFKYEYEGEWINKNPDPKHISSSARIRVGAIISGETDITWGEWLYPKSVTVKNSPLWTTDPKQQASYLVVKKWSRLYTPDVILGVYSSDELQDSKPMMRDINKAPVANIAERFNDVEKDEILDTETGEIVEVDPDVIDSIKDKLEMSESIGQLNKLLTELTLLPESEGKAELRELYKTKMAGFQNVKQS